MSDSIPDSIPTITARTVLKRFCVWLLICSISAAPSFYMAGDRSADRAGMSAGILLFVFGYTLCTSTVRFERFYRRRFIRRTLYAGYGLRLILSCLTILAVFGPPFAFSIIPDLFCGAFSLQIAGTLLGMTDRHIVETFSGALFVTCIQGAILNLIVFIFMTIMYWLCRAFGRPAVEPRGFEVVPMAQARQEAKVHQEPLAHHEPPPQQTDR